MIIAEIGLNHLGVNFLVDLYIRKLLETDIDGITLQVREPEYYCGEKRRYTLHSYEYENVCNQIHLAKKKFGVALADINQIDMFEKFGVDFYKVIRNDMLDDELMKKLISTNKKLIVSTGTCSQEEIDEFVSKYNTENITLNHTQISYDVKDCNLSAIQTMRSRFGTNISYGSHCDNHNVLYMSVAYQPSDILFYVKGWNAEEKTWPDDKHAISLKNVKQLVDDLKNLSKAIGTGIKDKMEIKIK